MAMSAENFSSSPDFLIKTSLEFENLVKTRIAWTRKQWVASGESGTRMNKLINSLNFWKNKLKPAVAENSIIFTLYNTECDVKTDLLQIITCIERLDSSIKVRGFSEFRNPHYLCIYFDNKEEKNIIFEKFKMIENSFVVMLTWALDSAVNVRSLKVHWLPRAFDIEVIKNALSKYVKCVEEERVSLTFMSGRIMPSGKVNFKVTINENYTAESVPHLIMVSEMEALVTIAGRQPLCLNCEVLGHISKKCKLRYCGVCDSLKEKEHVCCPKMKVNTYANIVKEGSECLSTIDPDDWGAAITAETPVDSVTEKDFIAKKIIALEQQIKGATDENAGIVLKPDMKRKANLSVADSFWSAGTSPDQVEGTSEEEDDVELEDSQVSDSYETIDQNQELPMNVDELHLGNFQVQKNKNTKKKLKRKKIKKIDNAQELQQYDSSKDMKEQEQRSYGKPLLNNSRRIKENQKFDKILESREFVFDD